MAKKAPTSDKPEEVQGEPEPAASAPAPPPPPPVLPPPPLPPLSIGATGGSLGDYVSFRKLITSQAMEVLSIVGHVVLTAIAVCLFCKWIEPWCHPYPWTALGVLILGNVLWRVLCEIVILLCRIHDRLASIDEKTQRG